MSKRLSILFYLKKQKSFIKGCQPIYMRLTIDAKRTEVSTKRECEPEKWNSGAGRAKGTKEEIRTLNSYIDSLQAKVLNVQQQIMTEGKPLSLELIKARVFGHKEKTRTLISVIDQHNGEIEQLIGKGFTKSTWTKYNTTKKHILDFLQWKHQISDIDIRELKYEFITDFEFFLKAEKNIDINTNGKYIKNIKKIIRECVIKGWLDKDPFLGYKVKNKYVEAPHLSAYELKLLEKKVFTIERLATVKDLFVFSCYTGYAYIDSFMAVPDNVEIGVDGKKWLIKNRQKSDIPSRLPLLPPALAIIEKYKNHPKVCNSGKLLPVLSNQKVNSYLKEIADLCGIKKELTFHVARHTFATTVTLSNGVPIESVSKMLGHKKLQTTQIYARVLDGKVSEDMKALNERLKQRDK